MCQGRHGKVWGKLCGIGSSLSTFTWVPGTELRLLNSYSQSLYPLSHLSCPLWSFFEFLILLITMPSGFFHVVICPRVSSFLCKAESPSLGCTDHTYLAHPFVFGGPLSFECFFGFPYTVSWCPSSCGSPPKQSCLLLQEITRFEERAWIPTPPFKGQK